LKPELVSISIARRLVEAIQGGVHPVNSRLPIETELAKQFGVSRVSVREALSALQFAGYVESRRGSGTVVLSASATDVGQQGMLARRLPTDHMQLLEARLVLEPQVLALGAFDPDPTALRMARQLIDGMALSLSTPEIDASTDLRVHLALVETCRNSFLVGECRELLDAAASPVYQRTRIDAWADTNLLEHWVDEHRVVYDAIAVGDATTAAKISRTHILTVVKRLSSDETLAAVDRARLLEIVARFGGGADGDASDTSAPVQAGAATDGGEGLGLG